MIGHATEEDLVAIGETARIGPRAIVPFAGAEGAVARALQGFADGRVVVGNALARALDVEQTAPRVQHGPAGHAHRTAGAARDVGMGEGDAIRHQPVDVGRDDLVIAQGVDRVEALVVGEEEDNVGFAGHVRLLGLVGNGIQ